MQFDFQQHRANPIVQNPIGSKQGPTAASLIDWYRSPSSSTAIAASSGGPPQSGHNEKSKITDGYTQLAVTNTIFIQRSTSKQGSERCSCGVRNPAKSTARGQQGPLSYTTSNPASVSTSHSCNLSRPSSNYGSKLRGQ
ncbi:hypothetical protein ACLOJK_023656 [Asimina triloba]